MIRFGIACGHRDDFTTQYVLEVLADLCGFGPVPSGHASLEIVVGAGTTPATGIPHLILPCWRCAPGDDAPLTTRCKDWLLTFRSSVLERRSPTGKEFFRVDDSGDVRLAFDPLVFILLGLGLIRDPSADHDLHGRLKETDDPFWVSELASFPYLNHISDVVMRATHAALRETSGFVLAWPRWPADTRWVLGVSHDIDHIRKWKGENRSLRVADVKRALVNREGVLETMKALITSYIGSALGLRDPYSNVMDIAEREHHLGIQASYYFGAVEQPESAFEITYPLDELRDAVDLHALRAKGHEIGLHASYRSAEDEQAMAAEKAALEAAAGSQLTGVRQHYLRFNRDVILPRQVKAGYLYDSSWAYPSRPGYRGGIAYPFWMAPSDRRQDLGLVELPMTVMDTTLREFMGLTNESMKPVLQNLVEEAARTSGLMVVNWHNNAFDREFGDAGEDIFLWLIEEAKHRGASISTLGAIADWWLYRRRLNLSIESDRLIFRHPAGLRSLQFQSLGTPPDLRGEGAVWIAEADSERGILEITTTGTELVLNLG